MAPPLTYDEDARNAIIKALERRASLRDAVAVAGVAWPTFTRWLRAGRLWRTDPTADGADERFAQLARDVDQAAAENAAALTGMLFGYAQGLPAQVTADGQVERPAVPGEWRAAEALLKFQADAPLRRAKLAREQAETRVALARANGTLVDRHDVTSGGKPLASMTNDELAAHIASLRRFVEG